MGIRSTLAASFDAASRFISPLSAANEKPRPPGNSHPVTREVAPGGFLLPHYRTFSGLVNVFSRVYSFRWDEALKRFPADAQAMRNDAYLMALFDERTVPLSRWKWQLVDLDADEDADPEPDRQKVKKQLEAIIRRTWRLSSLREYEREAIWFGRYGSQIVHGDDMVGGFRRKVIARHQPVHGDKLFTDFDGYDAVAINSAAIGGGHQFGDAVTYTDRMPVLRLRDPEWRQRFIIQKWRIRDGDYYDPYSAGQVGGIGLRHYVYWAWWLRDEMLSWATDFMEKVGALGVSIFYFEEGNVASENAAKAAAKEIKHSNALAVPLPKGRDPKTAGVDFIPANMTGVQFLKEFIGDYFERHIERLFVGQTLSGGTEGSGLGGTGVAALHQNTKFQLLASDAECFDDGYTEDLVQPLLELNFPGCPYRYGWKHILPDPEAETKLAAGATFVGMGGTVEEAEAREAAGFREPREGAKTLGGQQPGEAQALAPGEGDDGEDPDQLEAIADKLEAGEELTPEEEQAVAQYQGTRQIVSYAGPGEWEPPGEGRKNWRREIRPGEYEYSPTKPVERTKKAVDPSTGKRAKGQEPAAKSKGGTQDAERVAKAKERISAAKAKSAKVKPAIATNGEGKMSEQAAKIVGKIRPAKTGERAFTGAAEGEKIDSRLAGAIGEEIIIQHLKSIGYADAMQTSAFLDDDHNNLPMDLIMDHQLIEAKAGQSNNPDGVWALKYDGRFTKEQEAKFAKLKPEQVKAAKKKINAAKVKGIHERKERFIKEMTKKLGFKVGAGMMTVILNHTTKTADIFKFDGIHDRIPFKGEMAQKAYLRTVKYG